MPERVLRVLLPHRARPEEAELQVRSTAIAWATTLAARSQDLAHARCPRTAAYIENARMSASDYRASLPAVAATLRVPPRRSRPDAEETNKLRSNDGQAQKPQGLRTQMQAARRMRRGNSSRRSFARHIVGMHP